MAENVIVKLLENIIPLLLVLTLLTVVIYILVRKLLSPFSAIGNFLWEKSTTFYNRVAHTRKTKLETQLKTIKAESSEWRNKYINTTNSILEIKDKLNDLSKIFTELNEMEIGNVVMEHELDENIKQMGELKSGNPGNIFSKFMLGIKIKKLSGKNAKIEKTINNNENNINIKKELIREQINDLLDAVNNLSDKTLKN